MNGMSTIETYPAADEMPYEQMLQVINNYAEAKNNQDIEGLLKLYHPDGIMRSPAFNSVSQGAKQIEAGLESFFKLFPDYTMITEGQSCHQKTFIVWGEMQSTFTGVFKGRKTNNQKAAVPVFILFEFKDNMILRESFNFDLASLCHQSGISADSFCSDEF